MVNARLALQKKISQILQREKPLTSKNVSANLKLRFEKTNGKFAFTLPLRSREHDIRENAHNLLNKDSDDFLERVEICNDKELNFQLNREHYIKGLIESLQNGITAPEFLCDNPRNVLIEYSSPNIAKPFHVGHLRSTIIGNFIANVNMFFRNNVRRINYLGDWGTQFGYVQLGLSMANISEEALKQNPIKQLYDAYVYANKLGEEDSTIADKAKEIFSKLESGDKTFLSQWENIRKYTIDELDRTYNRLGIKFDEYEWESMYSMNKINNVISEMERLNLLSTDSDKRKVINLNENKSIPLIKSDGSSLYITRDIAAAIHRFEKYKFDSMYYIVDNGQATHFINLFSILKNMQVPWADSLKHVKFGKIRGMSTRKGTALFLQDFLDDVKAAMRKKQMQSENTKVNLEYDHPSTEILGVSAVIINDLKHKKHQDYNFDLDTALELKGDTGGTLQYTHCRLCSLEKNSGATIPTECIPSLLTEPLAENLIYYIGKFDEAVMKSYTELEPSILVLYLFRLSHATSKAWTVLTVKGEAPELANQRLLLMHTARMVLAEGMRLLGLTPLNEM